MKLLNSFKDLTKFELVLWITSLAVITFSFMLSHFGGVLSMIASLIGVTALIFVAKGYVLGQILTVIFACLYGLVSLELKYYGEMITYLCMTSPMAIVATVSWIKNPYKKTKEVKVNRPSKKQIFVMVVLACITTAAFYFILKALGNASLIVSTVSVTTSFIASYLTFLRNPYYAIAYAANDIVLIVLWVIASVTDISYIPMVFCFIMFFVNDIYGFINWRRMEKRQQSQA